MGDRSRHAQHVFRMGVVIGVGLVVFLIGRAALIPADFGLLGYYCAGALDDNRAHPIVYAGRAACLECHDGVYDPPAPGDPAYGLALTTAPALDPPNGNKHARLNCEACHGPLQTHVADEDKELPVPKVGADTLCLGCHRQIAGRPAFQPQIAPAVHATDVGETKDGCVGCHTPHWPKTAARTKGTRDTVDQD